jgi:hypothetical protein
MIILGGNMRFKAMKEAGWKEVPVIIADHLTSEQEREFIIKDNSGFGQWDWEMLAMEWDADKLEEWGLDLPNIQDFSGKNEEIDIDNLETDMTIKLTYTEEEYNIVKEQLSRIASTPEQAVWKLLGNE